MNKNKTILLVDDDITIINLLTDILSDEGFSVVPAYNGLQAIEKAKTDSVDLIILDWNMPEMDGLEALKILSANELTKNIPVVMLTGVMTDSENLKTALEAGAFDFIRKNFDKIELISRINAALKYVQANREMMHIKQNELVAAALQITKQNEFIQLQLNYIKDIIKDCKKGIRVPEKLEALYNVLLSYQNSSSWEQFNEHFSNVNPEFYRNLSLKHGDLSPSEIKLCALLKLNLSTKEIADITHLANDSIRTARVRLRKKLNLDSDINLTNYLMQF
ncbi:MAG: hypothetical protein A2275_13025 [Bacteroidetes bacterium RIFOXYA12_FULL_35_11]|nr:MAG: hypothetical protein A2X01_07315 [Bacteroidetes bacterium GWF2_35_48]OFY76870.1 MAG: hypothetical protein A2275_13025 [Bacteroidetes bacterium RIFOXYA12_FULL_35_11]OFZ02467.1 MAG: hypothetical protein A2491_06925 [Bacteroidetes bacterium RIFOXYC12_FULL_35_7]HBX50052.1 hypothetical protein [Bacteroidales bacterium]